MDELMLLAIIPANKKPKHYKQLLQLLEATGFLKPSSDPNKALIPNEESQQLTILKHKITDCIQLNIQWSKDYNQGASKRSFLQPTMEIPNCSREVRRTLQVTEITQAMKHPKL